MSEHMGLFLLLQTPDRKGSELRGVKGKTKGQSVCQWKVCTAEPSQLYVNVANCEIDSEEIPNHILCLMMASKGGIFKSQPQSFQTRRGQSRPNQTLPRVPHVSSDKDLIITVVFS